MLSLLYLYTTEVFNNRLNTYTWTCSGLANTGTENKRANITNIPNYYRIVLYVLVCNNFGSKFMIMNKFS